MRNQITGNLVKRCKNREASAVEEPSAKLSNACIHTAKNRLDFEAYIRVILHPDIGNVAAKTRWTDGNQPVFQFDFFAVLGVYCLLWVHNV